MSTILVVGGAGYVGSVLALELLGRGYAVRIFDRMYFGDAGLTAVRDQIDLRVGDVRVVPREVLDDVEVVINLAGISSDSTAEFNPRANSEINTVASISLARMCREHDVRRYLYGSSCSIYDSGLASDSADVLLDEAADVDPPGAYAGSKLAAERALLALATERFCVVSLRQATLFGFSPRMRYDLVVNALVKDALSSGSISLKSGGEMWRPLASVQDAARALVALVRAPHSAVSGETFNLVYGNFRISEVALRVRKALRATGVNADITTDYTYAGIRDYRVNGAKLERKLNFTPSVGLEESVTYMVQQIQRLNYTDFDNPLYYNAEWMRLLQQASGIIEVTGSVFEVGSQGFRALSPGSTA